MAHKIWIKSFKGFFYSERLFFVCVVMVASGSHLWEFRESTGTDMLSAAEKLYNTDKCFRQVLDT